MPEQKEIPKIVKPVNGFTFLEVAVICVIVFIVGVLMSNGLVEIITTELSSRLCEVVEHANN